VIERELGRFVSKKIPFNTSLSLITLWDVAKNHTITNSSSDKIREIRVALRVGGAITLIQSPGLYGKHPIGYSGRADPSQKSLKKAIRSEVVAAGPLVSIERIFENQKPDEDPQAKELSGHLTEPRERGLSAQPEIDKISAAKSSLACAPE
jgi:hypothetical protein